MMNVVALFLVVTSLVSAGMWSPKPQDQQNNQQKKHVEEFIVKDGHGVVVVEYEDQQGHHPNTKVSISADQDGRRKSSSDISSNDVSSPYKETRALDNAMENIKDAAASVLPNRGQGLSESDGHYSSARELICDAYGKCKHKIASVLEGKGERTKETAHKAKDTVEDAYEKTKETVSDKTQEVGELAKESVEKAAKTAKDMGKTLGTARDMGKTLGGDVQRNVSKVKEKAEEATAEMVTEHAAEKAKEAACSASEKVKESACSAAEKVKESEKHAADKVKTGTVELKNVTEKGLSGVLRKVRDMLYLFSGAIITLLEWIEPLLSAIGLFGHATAYGMCMWITFASSYVLSRVLSPHQFGMVQSKIYRVYFAAMGSSVGMAVLGHLLRHRQKMFSWKNVDGLQNFNLMLAELMILFNMLNLEPRSTKLMFERLKLEKEEGRGRDVGAGTRTEAEQQQAPLMAAPSITTPLQIDAEIREQEAVQPQIDRLNEMNQRLKKLNSYSSILNIMSLMALSWHLVYLAKRLNTSCY